VKENITTDHIRDTILANAISKNSVFIIHCQVDWELVQYCKEELLGDNKLHHVFTITGSLERAQAASCEDYVRQTWGYKGLQLLDAIVAGLAKDRLGDVTTIVLWLLLTILELEFFDMHRITIENLGGSVKRPGRT
jgi:hypothetical protein